MEPGIYGYFIPAIVITVTLIRYITEQFLVVKSSGTTAHAVTHQHDGGKSISNALRQFKSATSGYICWGIGPLSTKSRTQNVESHAGCIDWPLSHRIVRLLDRTIGCYLANVRPIGNVCYDRQQRSHTAIGLSSWW